MPMMQFLFCKNVEACVNKDLKSILNLKKNTYIYILIIVYLCGKVLDAFAERGISEGWTNQ